MFEAELTEEALLQREGGPRRAEADPLVILGVKVEAGTKARAA